MRGENSIEMMWFDTLEEQEYLDYRDFCRKHSIEPVDFYDNWIDHYVEIVEELI